MAYEDPWTPQQAPGIPVPTFQQVAQPPSFMDDPRARAALLSFGISMMQPPSFADNTVSQLGRALGNAGETSGRIDEQMRKDTELGIKQDEAASRQDLRGAQADAAVARAGAAEARASGAADRNTMSAERLALAQRESQNRSDRANLQARIRLSNLYANYVADTKTANDNGALAGGKNFKPAPILTMQDWIKSNPALKDLGLIPNDGTGQPDPNDVPPAPAAKPGTTAAPTQSNLNPPAPRDPTKRVTGQVYSTFDGRNVRWNGKNFVEVD